MPRQKSTAAIEQLTRLQQKPDTAVSLSFKEDASLRTAAWAVQNFGSQVLVSRVIEQYRKKPDRDDRGREIDIEDLSGKRGQGMLYAQEEAQDVAKEVADDLQGAIRRRGRGYDLGSLMLQGALDTTAVIASLEKAVELNDENIQPADVYRQAEATDMLDHMLVMENPENGSISYLL